MSTAFLLEGLILAMLSFVVWVLRRHVTRLENVERDYLPRGEHDRVISSLRNEIRSGQQSTHDRLDKLLLLLASKENGSK